RPAAPRLSCFARSSVCRPLVIARAATERDYSRVQLNLLHFSVRTLAIGAHQPRPLWFGSIAFASVHSEFPWIVILFLILRLLDPQDDEWSSPERCLRANPPDTHALAFVSTLSVSNATQCVPEVFAARAPSRREQPELVGRLLSMRQVWPRLDDRQERQVEG